jgi:hypothetical protein
MPFNIVSEGSIKGVEAFVKASQELGPDGKSTAPDQTQIETAKVLVLAELVLLDPKFTGARVTCSGECNPTSRQINLTIIGKQLHL